MSVLVLQSNERALVRRLMEVSDVYDIYRSHSPRWASAILTLRDATKQLRLQSGEPVQHSPREVIGVVLVASRSSNDSLVEAIGHLQQSPVVELQDLYRQLQRLPVEQIADPETKALFIFLAKVSEDSRIFENDG